MAMTVLQLRLEALAEHLNNAKDPLGWFDMLDPTTWQPPPDPWKSAVEMIRREAWVVRQALQKEIDGLATGRRTEQQAWSTYARVKRQSDAIFRESMDLLGGLALRDRLKEEYVCRFADELIRDCATHLGQASLFAIPAFEDPLSSTLRRVARVQFPDWHLWTLPLVAHEYGHVAMRDDYYKDLVADLIEQRAAKDIAAIVDQVRQQLSGLPDPRERVASVVQNLAGIDGDVRGVADRLAREASFLGNGGDETAAELMRNASCAISEHLVAVENRVMLLLADAFAAFTTGPAYACAALLFRLDPQSCQALGRPGDLERAEVIFSVLDEMNRVHLAPPAFDFHELVTDLRRFWHAVVSAAGLEEYVASEPFDAVRVLAAFRDVAIKSTAEYSKRDWKRARVLSTDWLTAVKDGDEPAVPERIGDFRLRDALNSAWASRLRLMVDLPPQERDKAKLLVEAVARKMCDDIIARSEPGTDPNPTYGKAQRPTGTGV